MVTALGEQGQRCLSVTARPQVSAESGPFLGKVNKGALVARGGC